MKEKKDKTSYYFKNTLAVLVILTLLLSAAYAWLMISIQGTKVNKVVVGTLSLKLKDDMTDGIHLENATPVSDTVGLNYDPYAFTLTNDGNIPSNYIIYLDNDLIEDGLTRMNDEYVKFNLVKNGTVGPNKLLSTIVQNNSKVLDTGTLEVGKTNTYYLRLWIDKDVDNSVMTTMFAGRIRVEAEQIKE